MNVFLTDFVIFTTVKTESQTFSAMDSVYQKPLISCPILTSCSKNMALYLSLSMLKTLNNLENEVVSLLLRSK